jgi:hypothetical protein
MKALFLFQKTIKEMLFMYSFNKFIKGFRNITRFVCAAVFLSLTGLFNVTVLADTGMEFFTESVNVLQTLVIALGAGLAIWGVVNLLEGYGNDNPGAKSQGMKQLMAGGGVALIGMVLVPLLSNLFG